MVHRLIPAMAMATALLVGACGDYDPPPELQATNLARGTYDPTRGDIVLTFSEPVDTTTLAVDVLTAKFNLERELCAPADGLPDGCDSAAQVAIAADDGRITVSDERTEVRIDGEELQHFSKYVVRVAGGLTDDAGRERTPEILVEFVVSGDLQGTPTTVEPGTFFGRLTTTSPLPVEVTMFFYVQIDAATGRAKLFGCDADPVKGGPDSGEESLKQDRWQADATPPLGFTVIAGGLINETEEGTKMELFPFDLEVTTPPVTAGDAVFRGAIVDGAPPGDVGGTRQLISGQIDAETVLLGGEVLPGTAQGDLILFRLTDEEAPPLADLLGPGVTEEDVHSTFED